MKRCKRVQVGDLIIRKIIVFLTLIRAVFRIVMSIIIRKLY